ncbi:uncharacterized protein [Aquarana catesbeiana]|uniref:uncharacterized protein n=1 Tax=Aquarana catesbeiana TaxID=8400 RepID=UPI003CC9C1D1
MSEETFSFLCAKLRPAMEKQNTNFRTSLPVRKIVAIVLWKLATNSEYRSIGHLFGVSKSSVCRCVQDFCKAVCTLLAPEIVHFPGREKLKDMADYFGNRKGWHSIILQGVVDGKGLFWNVNVGEPGSLHDARVLRLSTFWDWVCQGGLYPVCTNNICGVNVGYYVLGDSAYPLQNLLLTPEQQIYNKKTSRAWVVVENAFGRLKGRWQCLMKRNDSDIKLAKSMVLTCCALHNLCDSHGEDFHQDWNTSSEEPVLEIAAQDIEEECSEIRQALIWHLNV